MTDLLRILIAPLLWLAGFSAVYGLHGLLCGHGIDGSLFGLVSVPRALMALAYGLAVLLQAGLLAGLHASRFASPSSFVTSVSRATGWVGLVAAAWTLLPTVTTSSCF